MDSIFCVLRPASWMRTVHCFIFYNEHCTKLSRTNISPPISVDSLNISKIMSKSPKFEPE